MDWMNHDLFYKFKILLYNYTVDLPRAFNGVRNGIFVQKELSLIENFEKKSFPKEK